MENVNVNRVNNWVSGTHKGIGFSMKDGWLEVGGSEFMDLESETRIRNEIRTEIRNYFGKRLGGRIEGEGQ